MSEIPAMQRRSLGIEGGALVHRAEGAALRAGIQPGDLILRLNDVPVQGLSQLESLLQSHQGKSVALLVRRGPDTLFLPLQVPSEE